MPWARHRIPLFTAVVLDAAGLTALTIAITRDQVQVTSNALPQGAGLLILTLIYCSLGWLFGSYTILKLRRVSWTQAIARLGTTSAASIAAAAIVSYSFRLQITSNLFFRSNLIPIFLLLSFWSAFIRLLMRYHWPNDQKKKWQIIALKKERKILLDEWIKTKSFSQPPIIVTLDSSDLISNLKRSEAIAISSGVVNETSLQTFYYKAVNQGIPVHSLVEMAEQELQRIPPQWVGNQWLLFSGGIDGQHTNPQKQLKRYADVLISIFLLLITSPLLILSMIIVRLYDGGPAIYKQKRSGLLGQQFEIFKIRTMEKNSEPSGAQWAQINDKRVTAVGYWLRRTRLDELPQLVNVLRGEMSLIGPRPERPDLEKDLEEKISNYRLRHWVRPGLSGWAQVNMPYASSVDDSEIKLSYDLFYLRNATLWLDILILLKTIKIILKAAGR